MNEWLTVMTSSPAATPTARSARCSAVVQFDTAQACGAPMYSANSCSNAATSGPCVSQPEASGRCTARISLSPMTGRAIGTWRTPRDGRRSCRHRIRFALARPPRHQLAQAVFERHRRLEAELLRGPATCRPAGAAPD